jgi:hypothetical protein
MSRLLELLQKKREQIQAQASRQRAVNIPAGTSEWRILPSWRLAANPDDQTFWHDFGQHFIKDKAGSIKAVYVCSEKTFGRPCPVCDAITSALHQTHDDETANLVKESVAGARVLVNALHVDGQEPNKPVVLSLPPTVFNEIITLMESWMKDGVNIIDLANGHDLTFNKTGSGLNTRYTVSAKPRPRAVDPSVMKGVTDLDEYVKQESEEQARKAIANVNAAAGLLSAPSAAGAGTSLPKPSALSSLTVDDDEDLTRTIGESYVPPAAAPAAAAPAAAPAAVEKEVIDVPFDVVEEPKAQPAAAAPAAAATGSSDAELDSLLSELGIQ